MLIRLLLAILLTLGPVASGQAAGGPCSCSSETATEAVAVQSTSRSCCESAAEAPERGVCDDCPCSDPSGPVDGRSDCGCGCVIPLAPDQVPHSPSAIPSGAPDRGEIAAVPPRPVLAAADTTAAFVRPAGGFADPGPPRAGRWRLLLDSVLRL